jgi:maltooligosyltrehalose synthase
MAGKAAPPIGDVWGDATIALPEGVSGELRNVLTDKKVAATDRKLLCREMFETLPVAVLVAT